VVLIPQAIIDAVVWQRPRTLWPSNGGSAALETLGRIGLGLGLLAAAASAALVALAVLEDRDDNV